MINIVVNGSSITALPGSWSENIATLEPNYYVNLARPGSGNRFIAESTIDYLESANLPSSNTLIVVMWTGAHRKDIRFSFEWYKHYKNFYNYGQTIDHKSFWAFSGGLNPHGWQSHGDIKNIWEPIYKLSDETSMCVDNLHNFINLANYLKIHRYKYIFTTDSNYWSSPTPYHIFSGDPCYNHWCKEIPLYKNFKFDNWVFIDDNFTSLVELANPDHLDDSSHPNRFISNKYFNETMLPCIVKQVHM